MISEHVPDLENKNREEIICENGSRSRQDEKKMAEGAVVALGALSANEDEAASHKEDADEGTIQRGKCDHVLLSALSKPQHRDKVLEIEQIVQDFVTGSKEKELTFSADLAKSTFERLLVHRISQHWGLSTRVDGSKCLIVATRLQEEQKVPEVLLKEIEVEMEEDEDVAPQSSGPKRRQPGRILSNGKNGSHQNLYHDVGFRGRSAYSGNKEDEYEIARARIFNGHYCPPVMVNPVAYPGYPTYPQHDQIKVEQPTKARMRNQQEDSYDPDFHRHNPQYDNTSNDSGNTVYHPHPHMGMMHPVYAPMIQQEHMTPMVMHPYSAIPIAQVAYPPYAFIPMMGHEAMLYQQHPYQGMHMQQYVPDSQHKANGSESQKSVQESSDNCTDADV